MTVEYASSVSVSDRFFWLRILSRWPGSVYKLLYIDLLVYLISYLILALTYRLILCNYPVHKANFEGVIGYVRGIQSLTPLSFMLGFFVTSILTRWWSAVMTIPWMNTPAFLLQSYVVATDDTPENEAMARQLRRTVLRHMNLAWAISLADISGQIRDRFGVHRAGTGYRHSLQHRLEMLNKDDAVKRTFGFLITEEEIKVLKEHAERHNLSPKEAAPSNWQPLQWSTRLLQRGVQCGVIRTDRQYKQLVNMLANFRSSLGTLWMYADTNIPLVYVQVVIIAVYSYFIAELFTAQFIDKVETTSIAVTLQNSTTGFFPKTEFNAYVPIISIIKFLFFVGWFKVAMSLLNPFGTDEEDIPLSSIFNYNLEVSLDCGLAEPRSYPKDLSLEVADSCEAAASTIKSIMVTESNAANSCKAESVVDAAAFDANVALVKDDKIQMQTLQHDDGGV